jgi:hypothetical protein
MNYERSWIFGAAPTGLPPSAQFGWNLYKYAIASGTGDKKKMATAKRKMWQAALTFIPGYLTYKDWEAIWSGRKDLESLFFYKKM